MDAETYDEGTRPRELIGEQMTYLKENNKATVTFYDGKPLSIELPAMVELKVVDTEPSVKGATAQAQYKPATLETGLKITVPPFISVGDVLAIDTRESKYLSRATGSLVIPWRPRWFWQPRHFLPRSAVC